MDMNEYQRRAATTAIYPRHLGLLYTALGLTGEAGEVADQVKKMLRDDGGLVTPERREKLIAEAGDVQWYIAMLAKELGITLNDIAQANLDKLARRKEEKKLQGSGSER